jgi:hypothetical protein
MALFVHDLVISSNDATMHIVAHLLAIRNAGINPQTTPIFQKHKMYRRFQFVVLIGSVGMLMYAFVTMLFNLDFFPLEVLGDSLIAIVMTLLAIVFRLRATAAVSYGRIGDGGMQEILLSDLTGVDVRQLGGGRDWVDGMDLPAQPEIIREAHAPEVATDVVLASPDGTATIQASVVNAGA